MFLNVAYLCTLIVGKNMNMTKIVSCCRLLLQPPILLLYGSTTLHSCTAGTFMKHEPKWQDPKHRTFEKSGAASGGGDNDATINLDEDNGNPGGAAEERPPGRDRSKVSKKKANSDAGSASSSEWSARMEDLTLQRISFMQEESVRKSDHFQQLACIDEKRYEEMRSHNRSLLQCEQEKTRIMVENHEWDKLKEEKEEEERILAIDLDAYTPQQRLYYQVLQEEIVEKMEARRRKRQAP